jgi:predicted unusual protein kinase regulating ubiquinone biosynthesis (AarF/ABC1/UbiB family)
VAEEDDTGADPRDRLRRRLLASEARMPTSSLVRLSRTAMSLFRGRRLLGGGGAAVDPEALAALVGSIGQLKGVAMKVGQIFSYIDVALPDELRAALSVLQTSSPSMPFDVVAAILIEDLGPRARVLLAGLEPLPAAAASIGQVHRGTLADGAQVAVKVRYPDVDEAIVSDFRPAALGTRLASILSPGARIDGMIAEARERFLSECDYRREADAQERFARLYAGHATLVVPAVHRDYSSNRVLTTTWCEGDSHATWLASGPTQEQRDRIGVALFEFYIGTLYRHGLYNCDPHPGNYVHLRGERLAMLDYGCTRAFDPTFVAKLARLSAAAHADTREALHASLLELGIVDANRKYDFETARELIRGFYGPMLRDEVTAISLGEAAPFARVFERKRQLMKLHLPGEFLFLLRIRFGLMSVLERVGARANWFRLEREYIG